MPSHLTITAKAPAGAPTKGFNAQAGSDADAVGKSEFAALLDGAQPANDAKASAPSKAQASLDRLASLLSGGTQADVADQDPSDPDAIAAAIDATVPITNQIDAKTALADLVTYLAALKKSLAAGEAIDPALLKRIDAALDGLGDKFKIDLSAAGGPSADDLTAMVQSLAEGEDDAASQLTKALVPVTQSLMTGASAEADAAPLLKTIGDKLAKLLHAMNTGATADAGNTLAADLKNQGAADAVLSAAITKLESVAPKLDTTAAAPALATPKLNLTEPVITGKSADTTPATAAASVDKTEGAQPAAVVSVDAKPDGDTNGDGKGRSDDKKADAKASAARAPSVADIRNDAQAAAQNQTHVAQVDAAAPRVIQTGYQTSQQQLNLPQLAFELVRQVNDGNTRFQMRLDPPELGRIDVKLDIDKSGQITARLIVDKSETLDLMQRDQRALERALQQAGLDGSKTNLEFSLKQNPSSGGQQGRNDQAQPFSINGIMADDLEEAPPTINLYRASLTASGVNIIA